MNWITNPAPPSRSRCKASTSLDCGPPAAPRSACGPPSRAPGRRPSGIGNKLAAVAQRMVHGNLHLALLAGLRIVQQHAAAKILGNVRARINRVRGLEQRPAKRENGRAPAAASKVNFFPSAQSNLRLRQTASAIFCARSAPIAARNCCAPPQPAKGRPPSRSRPRCRAGRPAWKIPAPPSGCYAVVHRPSRFRRLLKIEVRRDAVGGERRAVLHHRRAEIHVGIFPGQFMTRMVNGRMSIFGYAAGAQHPAGDGDVPVRRSKQNSAHERQP